MTYRDAKKIKVGDGVDVGVYGGEVAVVSIEFDTQTTPAMFLRCSDKNTYHHSAIKNIVKNRKGSEE